MRNFIKFQKFQKKECKSFKLFSSTYALIYMLVCTLTLSSIFNFTTFANSIPYVHLQLRYDGKDHSYYEPKVYLEIDGKKLEDEDLPLEPVLIEERTLVPAREVFEEVGAEVEWDQEEYMVRVTYEDIVVRMYIDTLNAYKTGINGDNMEVLTMDIPPKLINSKTMIPIRFVSESIGLDVEWINDERLVQITTPEKEEELEEELDLITINSITLNDDELFEIELSDVVLDFDVAYLDDDNKVFAVDFYDTTSILEDDFLEELNLEEDYPNVESIEVTELEDDENSTRIIFNLADSLQRNYYFKNSTNTFYINFVEPKVTLLETYIEEIESTESDNEVDEDADSEVDEDADTEVDEDADSEVDEDADSEVDEESDSEVDEDADSEVDEDADSEVDEDADSEVDEDADSELDEDADSKVNGEFFDVIKLTSNHNLNKNDYSITYTESEEEDGQNQLTIKFEKSILNDLHPDLSATYLIKSLSYLPINDSDEEDDDSDYQYEDVFEINFYFDEDIFYSSFIERDALFVKVANKSYDGFTNNSEKEEEKEEEEKEEEEQEQEQEQEEEDQKEDSSNSQDDTTPGYNPDDYLVDSNDYLVDTNKDDFLTNYTPPSNNNTNSDIIDDIIADMNGGNSSSGGSTSNTGGIKNTLYPGAQGNDPVAISQNVLIINKPTNSNFNLNSVNYSDSYQNKKYTISFNADLSSTIAAGTYSLGSTYASSATVSHGSTTQLVINCTKLMEVIIVENSTSIYVCLVHPQEKYDHVIVIDAGHGGSDPGAISLDGTVYEKTVALDLAQRLQMLLASHSNIKTYLTRTGDTYPTLSERAAMANEVADFFISIHYNSFTSESVSGTETFYYSGSNNSNSSGLTSSTLATTVQNSLVSKLGLMDRGVKTANFQVLRETTKPGILAEIAFLSNPSDLSKIKTDSFKANAASAMYDAIIKVTNSYRNSRTSSIYSNNFYYN